MAFAYTVKDQGGMYFVTFTVNQWVDVFTRQLYVDILIGSIKYWQQNKGLLVYAWVVMSNHCHMIISSDKEPLSGIIRDLKKHTSKKILEAIEANPQESRKRWLVWLLKQNGKIVFWKEGYHGEEILSENFMQTKIDYIHFNPVRAAIVEKEEEYLNSSCGQFYGIRKSAIELAEL